MPDSFAPSGVEEDPLFVTLAGGAAPNTVTADQGAPNAGAALAWPVSVESMSLVKKTFAASALGDTTVHTPGAGKKIRLYFFGYSAGFGVLGVLAGLKLAGYNGGAVFDQQYLVAAGQPYARNIQGGKRYVEGAADGALVVNLSAAQAVYVNYELEEI